MQALLLFARLFRLNFRFGTSDRVSTGNGLQLLLKHALILCRADRPRRFHEALALASRLLLFRCLCHVQITPYASLSHLL